MYPGTHFPELPYQRYPLVNPVPYLFIFRTVISAGVLYFPRKQADVHLSTYDMKFYFYLFEGPFKIQKNGVYLSEISFFVSEILMFFYYAIRSVMTSYCLQLKMVKY